MAKYLLDTNHISPLVTPGHPLRRRVRKVWRAGHVFHTCAPVVTEVRFGFLILPKAADSERQYRRLRPAVKVWWVKENDAELAARLQTSLRRRGVQLKTVDALIAAVALQHDFTVLTTDKDFQPIGNLRVENWLLP